MNFENPKNDTEKIDEVSGWSVVKMIKNGQYEDAKQNFEQDDIVLNDEMVETIGWIVVKKIKEGDVDSAETIQEKFNIELNEEMNSMVSMLENKQEAQSASDEENEKGEEGAEDDSDYINEREGWILKRQENEEKEEAEKVCPKCGNVSAPSANFCAKCGNVYEDANSIGTLRNSLTKNQFQYLMDVRLILDNQNISQDEATARLEKIGKHYADSLSKEEKEDVITKYREHLNLQ